MNNYNMKEKLIKMDDSWDIIVVGGGPAGCTAAASAAREGAKTLLIEATGCLGGMGTSGLVPSWTPFSDKEKIIYKGMAEKIFNESKKSLPHLKEKWDWVTIDPEHLKRVYDELVTESGATILFNTLLSAVETDDLGTVEAIITSNKAGLTALKAKVYIDCTGDADLSAWAGAEFYKGDEKTGEMQPASHCFILSNLDTSGFLNGNSIHPKNPNSPIYEIVKDGKYPLIPDVHLCHRLIGPSTIGFNAGHIWNVDNTDPYSTSKALIQGRKIAAAYRDSFAEYHPKAFANSYLVSTGTLLGIRETRRVIGDYYLTLEDYQARRSFEDEICRNNYPIDIHTAQNEIEQANSGELDVMHRFQQYEKGESHGIPYRCLTPRGLKNVLVAGRSISSDRLVNGSVRVMPACLAMGEAAGIAGVLASKMDVPDVHTVDVRVLRSRLKDEGAYLPDID